METMINAIKNSFTTEISRNGKEYSDLRKLSGQLQLLISTNQDLFGIKRSKKDLELEQRRLELSIDKQEQLIEEIKNNKVYENAFEWRFEFPEVLNNEGNFVGFDVVIGNPPYGVIIEKATIENLKSNVGIKSVQNLSDSYFVFITLGNALNQRKGYSSYIIPNTWRLISSAKLFRDEFIKSGGLYKIDSYLKPIFTDAVVDCDIVFAEKNGNNSNIILNANLNENKTKSNALSKIILLKQKSINSNLSEFEYELLQKISQGCKNLNQIVLVKNGVKLYEVGKGNPKQTKEILDKKPFTQKVRLDETFIPLIGGSNFHKYIIKWNNDNFISYGPWLAAPRDKNIFDAYEKIIVRQTSDKLIAAIITSGFVMRNNTHILILNNSNFHLKYILALINSKLFDFIYWTINPERGEVLAEVKAIHLDILPIKQLTKEKQEPYCALVDLITFQKKEGNNTSDLETQIDQLVYQLYNLTEEEIKIVEGTS